MLRSCRREVSDEGANETNDTIYDADVIAPSPTSACLGVEGHSYQNCSWTPWNGDAKLGQAQAGATSNGRQYSKVFRREFAHRHLFGRSSTIPAYDTNTTPQPNPITVDPAASMRVELATHATIYAEVSNTGSTFQADRGWLTDPTIQIAS